MDNNIILSENITKYKIITLRDTQVILDRDLAKFYKVETRALKQAVNRNKNRFPDDFMLVLNDDEIDLLVSQSVIPSKKHLGGALPFAFTEQGVANLATVLSSDIAIGINIEIMRAFVAMRRFMSKNAGVFARLSSVERKQLEFEIKTENNFRKVFDALQTEKPKQGIFYDGQIFDAYQFVSDLVRNASDSIILIDNYIDDSVLMLFSKRRKDVSVTIYTKKVSPQLRLDLDKFNSQYEKIEVREFDNSHDRFIIIDSDKIYHFGASLKDLGKKWFAFSRFDKGAVEMLSRLR